MLTRQRTTATWNSDGVRGARDGRSTKGSTSCARRPPATIGLPALLVLGVEAGGLGTYFIVHRNNLNGEAEALCLDASCSRPEFERHAQLISDAKAAQTRGVVSILTGSACLLGAGLWYFLQDDGLSDHSVSIKPINGLSIAYGRSW
jgi:hypothetical protein